MPLDFYGYFQLAGLGLFLLVVVWRAVSVAKKAQRKPVHLSLQHNGVQHGIVLVLFIGVNLWIVMILLHVLAPEVRILPLFLYRTLAAPWMRFPGTVLIGIGFSLFVLALRTLGVSWRLGIDEQQPGALIITGVYAFSRHPIYLFFNLYFLGTFLLNGTLVFLLFCLFAAVVLHLQILQEERFLLRVHGLAYSSYVRHTRRYFTLSLRQWGARDEVRC